MGSFNTKGWLSHLSMSYDERIFAMICIAEGKHTANMDPHSGELSTTYRPYGKLTPVCLPIFGKYDSYGKIYKIERTESVNDIEKFFGTDINTIVDVLDDVTTIFRCHYECDETKHTLELYESFREKLGLTYDDYDIKSNPLHIVLVMDYIETYEAAYKQFYNEAIEGLCYDRSNYSIDESVTKKWKDEYLQKYYKDEWHYYELPSYLRKDTRNGIKSGGLYSGWNDFYDILLIYKDESQHDENGNHIRKDDKRYDFNKKWQNLEALLYNETIEDELVKFISFLWFLHNAYIEIAYSYPTTQEDINMNVINFHKELCNIKIAEY